MTTEREEPGHRSGQMLDDIVQDADEYCNYLKEKHVQQTRLLDAGFRGESINGVKECSFLSKRKDA